MGSEGCADGAAAAAAWRKEKAELELAAADPPGPDPPGPAAAAPPGLAAASWIGVATPTETREALDSIDCAIAPSGAPCESAAEPCGVAWPRGCVGSAQTHISASTSVSALKA